MHSFRNRYSFSGLVAAILLLSLGLSACDAAGPDDEVDDTIASVQLRLFEEETNETVTLTVTGDELDAGALFDADTLFLASPGSAYEGRIDFYNAQGENITGQIRQEAENYQIFYSPEGFTITVTDEESSYGSNEFGADLPVGLEFRAVISEQSEGGDRTLRVQVGRFEPGRKNGSTLNVAPVVDFRVPVRIGLPLSAGPGFTEVITLAELTLARTDGTETWIARVSDVDGVNYGQVVAPTLEVEFCTPDKGGEMVCGLPQFTDPGTITLMPGTYEGSWVLRNEFQNLSLTEEILEEGVWHQFFYTRIGYRNAITITDADENGMPIGLTFELTVPENIMITGSFQITLAHFHPARGEVKGANAAGVQNDLQFRIPLQVDLNGLPEPITRAVITLERADGEETITVVAENEVGTSPGLFESVVVERCTGGGDQRQCTSGEGLVLPQGAHYTGSVMVFDDESGYPVMEEIQEEDHLHQFFYEGELKRYISITDMDEVGLPVGFHFEVDVPAESILGSLEVNLSHYGRNSFKDGVQASIENDLQLSIPLVVQ